MRHKIIYTEDYALILSDEQIEDVRPFIGRYHLEKGLIINQFPTYLTDLSECKLIIAHRPLTDAPILKGVPLLPEFEDDDFLNTEIQVVGDNKTMSVSNFLKKYGKETYKYAEEDLINAYERGMNNIDSDGCHIDQPSDDFNDFIQHLQQPKLPKYFECEMEPKYKHIGAVKGIYGSGFRKQNLMYGLPKTITNSQGQKELIGTYEGGDQC
jgi:hypothetical protein